MNSDRVNYINIGLMVLSAILAVALPFELFLFSYAVLGPLHYLTEISWLYDRQFFSPGKWDWVPLVIFSLLVLMGSAYVIGDYSIKGLSGLSTELTFAGFALAFLFLMTQDFWMRIFGSILILFGVFIINTQGIGYAIFTVYLPTLIHVYLFTGAFILFGALKRNSKTGYLSILVFVLCPILIMLVIPHFEGYAVAEYVRKSYFGFVILNQKIADHFHLIPDAINTGFVLFPFASFDEVFSHPTSIIITRFIAFAYTYHYLNWFSKTSIIKWHKVPKIRFIGVLVLWAISVFLYAYDYQYGFKWLFLLSFMHVFLEFPLNHQSFIGISKEIRIRLQK